MERFYRFADISFRITGKDRDMFQDDGVLEMFRTSDEVWDCDLNYEIVDQFPESEGTCVYRGSQIQVFRKEDTQIVWMGDIDRPHTRISRCWRKTHVQFLRKNIPDRIRPRQVLNGLEAEHHIVRHGGFLLHSSFVRIGDKAILFTAPSGTGKSTQAELWCKYRNAEIMNGDRTAVMPTADGVMAYGIPYCGTSGICRNAKLPIAAIVYLSQGKRSEVQSLTGLRAFRRLWEGCSVNVWDKKDVDQCCHSVTETVGKVPVLHLTCTPDESAVKVLESFLEGRI